MSPLGGIHDCLFIRVLVLKRKLDAFRDFQELEFFLTSAITPSSDEEASLVLLILVG
jgi:hypothetical protein